MRRVLHQQEGATLILVAITLFFLLVLTAFVTDLGVVFTARGQAQNAADAGALAGATARAFDEWTDPPATDGLAYHSAYNAARANNVFGEPPAATVSWACPDWYTGTSKCVQVETYRDGSSDGTNTSTPLPTFFSPIIPGGPDVMKTKATATAAIEDVNHTDCLKPWLIPDDFTDTNGNGVFDVGIDVYTAPGYTEDDVGTSLMLRPGSSKDAAAPSNYYGIGDASTYKEAIEGCIIDATVNDTIQTLPGAKVGPTQQGVSDLLVNGPVVVLVGLFSPEAWALADRHTGTFDMVITNIMGFRIDSVQSDGTINGIIVNAPGEEDPAGGTPPPGAGFLKTIQLLR